MALKGLPIVVPLTISNNDFVISINENCLSGRREDGLTQFVSLCVCVLNYTRTLNLVVKTVEGKGLHLLLGSTFRVADLYV